MDASELAIFAYYVLVPISLAVINVLKGKYWFALIGFLFAGTVSIVGAIRLAKPNSWWGQRYGDDKRARSLNRFNEQMARRDPGWVDRLDADPESAARRIDGDWPDDDPLLWDKITRKAYKREHGHWPEQAPVAANNS